MFGLPRPVVPAVIILAFIVLGVLTLAPAAPGLLDDPVPLGDALKALRNAIGDHPRVLKVEIDAKAVAIEAQDLANRSHVNAWTYKLLTLGPIAVPHLAGPAPVALQLLDPDLDANLFDLDAVDLGGLPALQAAAIKRAHLADPPISVRIAIERTHTILPKAKAGEVRTTLSFSTGREHAEIYADEKGGIYGAELAGTRYAKTVSLLHEPALIGNAIAAFRGAVGTETPLTSVSIDHTNVGFTTTQPDAAMAKMFTGMPSVATYTWSIEGLQRRLGTIVFPVGQPAAPFLLADYDWSGIAQLQSDALAKLAIAKAEISEMRLEKINRHPGAPVLEWEIDAVDPDGETSKIYADGKGAITGVELPESRRVRTPVNWLDPVMMAAAISRLGASFGPDTRIATIEFDDTKGGRITIEEVAKSGQFASFDFTADGVKRADMTFSLSTGSPGLRLADLAVFTAAKFAALEDAAMKKMTAGKKGYLQSVTIGPNGFDPQAGAKAVDIYIRDIPVNSAKAEYGWALYDFDGKYIDGVSLD